MPTSPLRSRRARRALPGLALVLGLVAAACTPPPGPDPDPGPGDGEPFTVVFLADPEARMRGNTDAEVAGYVQDLLAYTTTRDVRFAHEGGAHRIDPELVLIGGDISADRDTSVAEDLPLYQPLLDAGIPVLAGFGNHDYDPASFSDGPGYSLAGHLSNDNTERFVRETYVRSAQVSSELTFTEVPPTAVHGPSTYHATFRGVDVVNLNTFAHQPSYRYPEGWPLTCNLPAGGAGCQTFVSAEPQIAAMEALLSDDPSTPTIFFQHYPTISTSWWDDYGASGTTTQQKVDRLLGMMARFEHTILLSGHIHQPLSIGLRVGDRVLTERTAPYFGGEGGDDPTRGGGFLALLVSPTEGILEVRTIPTAAG